MKGIVILSVPDGTEFSALPDFVQHFMDQYLHVEKGKSGWQMTGTRVYNGRKLILFVSIIPHKHLDKHIKMFNGSYGVGWTIEAAQSWTVKPIYDADGNQTGWDGVYKALPATLNEYLADIVDDQGNTSRPQAPYHYSSFDGASGWVEAQPE
jgi:hypothetical protein